MTVSATNQYLPFANHPKPIFIDQNDQKLKQKPSSSKVGGKQVVMLHVFYLELPRNVKTMEQLLRLADKVSFGGAPVSVGAALKGALVIRSIFGVGTVCLTKTTLPGRWVSIANSQEPILPGPWVFNPENSVPLQASGLKSRK